VSLLIFEQVAFCVSLVIPLSKQDEGEKMIDLFFFDHGPFLETSQKHG
jgi:hypothetical protein